jgi:EAL domain-containing protein (putative c-di-GMP-specific phosphodiesterase class I)
VSTLLERVLEPRSLRVVFQPVVKTATQGRVVEYLEALVRGPHGSTLESPRALFSYARRKHAESQLDRTAIHAALRDARMLPEHVALGLNVHISTLAGDPEFPNFLCEKAQECWIDPRRLVLELVEEGTAWDERGLREAVACLRSIGIRIALDDFGAGRSNLGLLPDCRPDYLKVDRCLVHGCDADAQRRAILEAVIGLSRSLHCSVVAEGVEQQAELHAVRELGLTHVQGFLYGQPQPAAVLNALLGPDGLLPMGVC